MADVFLKTPAGDKCTVMNGDLLLPLVGNYSAHLVFADAQAVPEGLCTLSWLGKEFSGYVISERSGIDEGRISCLFVGGKGNLSKSVPSKMYDYQHSVRLPLQEIIASVGESLSSTSDQSVLSKTLPNWIRRAGDADSLINALCDKAGSIWRMLPDGSLFVGTNKWVQANSFDFDLLNPLPTYGAAMFAVQNFGVLPGERFPVTPLDISGRKVACCQYKLEDDSLRLLVWFAEENSSQETDPLHAGLASYIKETMRFVDYFAHYPCEVALQRSDGSLDVYPDSDRLPPLTSVPLRVPVGGTSLVVNAKDRVTVIFENADPTRYSAQLYEPGNPTRLLALKGGEVNGGSVTLAVAGMGVTIGGSYTDGFGSTSMLAPATSVTFSIKGQITNGWARWKVTNEVNSD